MEAFVPLPAPLDRIEPVRAVRSTLLSGSIQALRNRHRYEDYFKVLPAQHHEAIRALVAGVWIPIDLARAHYDALDRLLPDVSQQIEMGRDVADRIHKTILATVAKAATGAGVTPWIGLAQLPKLWERTFAGGAVGVMRVGLKDARIDMIKLSLLETSYFRHAFTGVLAAGIELFCRRVFITQLPRRGDVFSFKASWAG